MKKKKKKNILIVNIEYFFALCTIHILRLMPLSWAYGINNILCRIFYLVDFHHRKRAIQHLIHAGIAKSTIEARQIAVKNFINMGKIWVETIKFDQYVNPENVHEYISWAGDQEAIDILKEPTSVIIIGAHFGNWEVSGLGCSILVKPIVSVFRMFDNEKIGKYILDKRKKFKQEICSKKQALKPLLKAIRQKKAVGILADQHASTSEGVETVFFGHPARTHASPAFLHIKTKTPIVVGVSRRIDNKLHFEYLMKGPFKINEKLPEKDQIKDICQQFTTAIEEIVRDYPDQWVWCHRRWLDLNRKWRKKENKTDCLQQSIMI
jgi:Kdo2-lipid IVA lauroyltransferase/acyltransferase